MNDEHIAVLTTGRRDWGLLRPVCNAIGSGQGQRLSLLAGGVACSPTFGDMVKRIREAGFYESSPPPQRGSRR